MSGMDGFCEAHRERAGMKVPAYRLGLCLECFRGDPINKEVEIVISGPWKCASRSCNNPLKIGNRYFCDRCTRRIKLQNEYKRKIRPIWNIYQRERYHAQRENKKPKSLSQIREEVA